MLALVHDTIFIVTGIYISNLQDFKILWFILME